MNVQNLDQNKEIISQIVSSYHAKTGTNWRRAFVDHPEWQEKLGVKTKQDRQKLYLHVNKLKRNGEFGESHVSRKTLYQRRYRARVKNVNHQSNHRNSAPEHLCKVCPCCGTSIEAVEMALRLGKNS